MGKLKIRNITKEDLNELAGIYSEVYHVFDVGEKWTRESAYNLLRYWLERQPDLALLAEYNGKIVGAFVTGIKPWWDGNHLSDGELFVHPKYQKKGIGKELSKEIYHLAIKKYNAIRFDGFTFKMKEFPLKWYKSQGFKEIKEWVMISADLKEALQSLEKQP